MKRYPIIESNMHKHWRLFLHLKSIVTKRQFWILNLKNPSEIRAQQMHWIKKRSFDEKQLPIQKIAFVTNTLSYEFDDKNIVKIITE
jgi:hypothetical protein